MNRDGPRLTPALILCLWVVLLASAWPGCLVFSPGEELQEGEDLLSGPLPVRSVMPLSLIFPSFLADGAGSLPAGRSRASWNTLYGSVLVRENRAQDSLNVDGEFMRTAVEIRHGLGRGLELGVEIPYLHYSSGFLDRTVEEYHDLFGFPQGRRDRNPDDQYAASYVSGGRRFFGAEEDGLHLADIPLTLKWTLMNPKPRGFGLAARGMVEIPSGDEDEGFGSGRFDTGLGVAAQQNFGPALAGILNVSHTFRSRPSSFEGIIKVRDVTQGTLALEGAMSRSFSLVLQTDYETPTLEGGAISDFEHAQWSASLGVNCRAGGGVGLKFFFTEGITTHTAPDFTLGLSLAVEF